MDVTCVSHDRYSKFIRGKDLSSKSAQDLSCVLGKRRRRRKRRGASASEEGHREAKVSEGTSHPSIGYIGDRQTDMWTCACSSQLG